MLFLQLFQIGRRSLLFLFSAFQCGSKAVGSADCFIGSSFCCSQGGWIYCGNCIVDGSFVCQDCAEFRVGSLQVRSYFLGVVCFPEFEVSRSLKQLSYTFGFFDTRKFHHDTSHFVFEALDVGLNHTKAVDTCTKHVVWVRYGSFYFFSQHLFNFGVWWFLVYFVFELLCREEFREFGTRCNFVILFNKQCDHVVLAGGCLFGSFGQCFVESFVGLVVSQCFDNIGYRHFEDNVHTSLKVQT